MHALVSVDCATGALRRYERVVWAVGIGQAAPSPLRLTHEAIPEDWGTGWEWDRRDVEIMRTSPPCAYAVREMPHDLPPMNPEPGGLPPARVA